MQKFHGYMGQSKILEWNKIDAICYQEILNIQIEPWILFRGVSDVVTNIQKILLAQFTEFFSRKYIACLNYTFSAPLFKISIADLNFKLKTDIAAARV